MPVPQTPLHEQCDCCLEPWQVYYCHKHGTHGRLCLGCFAKYRSHLPTGMLITMTRAFRNKEVRKYYVQLLRQEHNNVTKQA